MQFLAVVLALSSSAEPSQRILFGLEARFLCSELRPIPLELIERTQVSLEIPKGCPDAGATLFLELDCSREPCEGTVRRGRQVIASLKEWNTSLVVTTPARFDAGPTSKLAIKITSRERLVVEHPSPAPAMVITGQSSDGAHRASALAREGEPVSFTFDSVTFDLRFSRAVDAGVVLELEAPGLPRLRQRVAPGEPLALDCAAEHLKCQGTLRFGVQERGE